MRPLTPAARDAGFVALVVAGFAALATVAAKAGGDVPAMALLPIGAAGAAVAGLVFLYACAGSRAALIAYLAVLVFVNDALFRVRDPGNLGLDWQNAMKFALWAGAGAIGVCHLPRTQAWLLRFPTLLAVVYLGGALASSAYSAAPAYSFSTAFGMLSLLLFAGALVVTLSEKQILLTFVLSLCLFTLLGWVVYFVVPALGRSPFITADGSLIERICGLAGQANALGGVLAVYLALIFLLWYRGHCGILVLAPLAAIGLGTLLAADSRTALLSVMVGVAAVLARYSLWTWGASMLAGSLGLVLIAGVPLRYLMGLTGGLSRSGDPTELLTLTGRTDIWAFVWDKIVLRPWFGYGYNSSKFILPEFLGLPGLIVDEAHNTWLQNLLGLGIVGTLPLLVLMVALLVQYARAPDPFRDLFLFIVLVWGITVAGAFGSTPTVMTLATFVSVLHVARPATPSSAKARHR